VVEVEVVIQVQELIILGEMVVLVVEKAIKMQVGV
tara:strand:+ start:43 stop:147 length:105 start_codon:yes stop_codon:yes gene_type:complete